MSDSFGTLRLQLEVGRRFPLTVAVAGATDGDNAGHVAYGIAAAFAAPGFRTLVVLDDDVPEMGRAAPQVQRLGAIATAVAFSRQDGPDAVRLATSGNGEPVSEVLEALYALHDTYSVIVFEAPGAATRSDMLARTMLADIAVIAVRLGRAVCPADRALVERLKALKVPVLGVAGTRTVPVAARLRIAVSRAATVVVGAPSRT